MVVISPSPTPSSLPMTPLASAVTQPSPAPGVLAAAKALATANTPAARSAFIAAVSAAMASYTGPKDPASAIGYLYGMTQDEFAITGALLNLAQAQCSASATATTATAAPTPGPAPFVTIFSGPTFSRTVDVSTAASPVTITFPTGLMSVMVGKGASITMQAPGRSATVPGPASVQDTDGKLGFAAYTSAIVSKTQESFQGGMSTGDDGGIMLPLVGLGILGYLTLARQK